MTLSEIIKRIEAGETGRPVEVEIALAVGLWPAHEIDRVVRLPNGGEPIVWFKRIEYSHGDAPGTPAYTTSLDAALTLVPEGWFVRQIDDQSESSRSVGILHWAELTPPNGWTNERPWPHTLSHAATRPLALCIAALKAREAQS